VVIPEIRASVGDEHLARLRAVARTDDAALLEDVHQAGGARVADAQAALEQRRGGAVELSHDADRVLEQSVADLLALSVLASLAFDGGLQDGELVLGLTLLAPEIRHPIELSLRNVDALRAHGLRLIGGEEEHVAAAQEFLRAGH